MDCVFGELKTTASFPQRYEVEIARHEAEYRRVFEKIKEQFRPMVTEPLYESSLLAAVPEVAGYGSPNWAGTYALFVTAALRGDVHSASEFRDRLHRQLEGRRGIGWANEALNVADNLFKLFNADTSMFRGQLVEMLNLNRKRLTVRLLNEPSLGELE